MTGKRASTGQGRIGRRLSLEDFHALFGEVVEWRLDPELQEPDPAGRAELPFAFAKGLRLSARLIYAIRKALSSTPFDVHWGQLVSPDDELCSPECDVIVHKQGYIQEWNGTTTPVMDFKFIESSLAVAVVSCKSKIESVRAEEKNYCQKVRRYVENVLLFGECCPVGKACKLKNDAQKAGYRGFWYLYTLAPADGEPGIDEEVWLDFLRTLREIAERHS